MSDDATEVRLTHLEDAVTEIKSAVKSIDTSLQTLARLEERHQETRDGLQRAFSGLKDHEERIKMVEMELPVTKLVRGWGIAGVIGLCAIVLGSILKEFVS